jgi:hypothetical protein
MKFVHPEFLWAFGVLAIPILIHLFNFRKYKVLYFSSLKFIQFVDQQTRSTQKLKHLLILLARLLAFSSLVMAFAQPFLPAGTKSTQGGKPVIAIYIDNSFSMSMKGTEGEMISEAREMARKMILNASLDTRFMLVTNAMNGVEQQIVSKIEALERLDKIEIIPLIRDIAQVIEWQKNTLEREHETKQKIGTRQFVIFSDFQKNSTDFSQLKSDRESFYFPVKITPQELSNLFVDSVWFTSPIQKIGQNNELNVRVRNFGKNDLTNVALHVEIGSIKRDVFLDIAGKDKTITTIHYTEQKEGFQSGIVSVNDKQFFYDDDYFFSYSVAKRGSILLINGEDAVPGIALVYSLDDFYEVQEIDQKAFTLDALSQKELVILNGTKELTSGLAENLTEYANEEGALALFPGEDINFLTSGWNEFLQNLKMPTLSSSLADGVKIKRINFQDAFFKPVFEKNPENLNLPTVAKVYRAVSSFHTKAIPLIELQNGLPLYCRSLGRNAVFLYTSSLVQNYGSFTSNALFSTILLRTAELSKRKVPISFIIGDESRFPLFSKLTKESPLHLKNKEVDFIPKTVRKGSVTYLALTGEEALENLKAGTYDIIDEEKMGILSLNYDRKESHVEAFSRDEVAALFQKQGIEHLTMSEISDGQSLTKIDLEKPHEYWRIFILLGLLFILTEIALLKIWKN